MSTDKQYADYTTVSGHKLKFYPVAETIIAAIVPGEPKPRRPMVEVPVGTKGQVQTRPAKDGDVEFDVWKSDLEDWEERRDDLQVMARLILSLKDYEYPKDLSLPDILQELAAEGLFREPKTSIEKKAFYLYSNVITSPIDEQEIMFIIQRLGGIPEEVIDQMKETFRRTLSRDTTDGDREEYKSEE